MLLSRVADALYWIGRYLERAEHTARLIDVRLDLGLDRGRIPTAGISSACTPRSDCSGTGSAGESGRARRPAGLRRGQPRLGGGVRHRRARERAAGARGDQLRHVGAGQRAVPAPEQARHRRDVVGPAALHVALVIEGVHLFEGITDATMGHGEGWQYLQVGRFLERAERDRGARRSPFHASGSIAAARSPRVGRAAAIVLGARGVLPLLHRRPRAGADRGVPAAQRGVSAFGALRGRSRRIRAPRHRAAHRPRRRRPRRAAGRPPARVARLRAGGRDPERRSARVPGGHRPSRARQIHAALYQSYITYPIESALPA